VVGGGRTGRIEGFDDRALRNDGDVNCVIAQNCFGAMP